MKKSKKRNLKRPVIKITGEHLEVVSVLVEIVSVLGVLGILLLEAVWFFLSIFGVMHK